MDSVHSMTSMQEGLNQRMEGVRQRAKSITRRAVDLAKPHIKALDDAFVKEFPQTEGMTPRQKIGYALQPKHREQAAIVAGEHLKDHVTALNRMAQGALNTAETRLHDGIDRTFGRRTPAAPVPTETMPQLPPLQPPRAA